MIPKIFFLDEGILFFKTFHLCSTLFLFPLSVYKISDYLPNYNVEFLTAGIFRMWSVHSQALTGHCFIK